MRRVLGLCAALLLQFYYLCRTRLQHRQKRRLIALISALQVLSPTQLAQQLAHQSDPLLRLCRGKLFAGESCGSVLSPGLKVAYSKVLSGSGSVLGSGSEVLRVVEPAFMEMRDSSITLKLFQTHQSVILPTRVLQVRSKGLLQRAREAIDRLFAPTQGPLSIPDFFNGDSVYELFLPDGAECTVLGRFEQQGSELVCSQPRMVFQNQQQMLRFVQDSLRGLRAAQVILALGTVLVAGLLLREGYRGYQSLKNSLSESFSLTGLQRIVQRSRVCGQCRRNLSCVYYPRCRHMSVCQQCQSVPAGPCVECRGSAVDCMEMFVC